jgi:hypothetical protein
MPTFELTSDTNNQPVLTREFDVWVIVRHTRSGDQRIAIIDDDGDNRQYVMDKAEEVAREAAQMYGQGSTSVFRGVLVLDQEPEQQD